MPGAKTPSSLTTKMVGFLSESINDQKEYAKLDIFVKRLHN
jgi:hypothetical protein